MKRVFLAGTTTRTTWRQELITRLMVRGVQPEQIINPQLPYDDDYTTQHMEAERAAKRDPETIVLVYICPAVKKDTGLSVREAIKLAERLGPISMFEIAKFAYTAPGRTVIVFDTASFTVGGRPRLVLEGLAAELTEDLGTPPYFPDLQAAEDWIVEQLTGT